MIDKEEAAARRGIFIIDASAGYLRDRNMNRLRGMDMHRIVDVFNRSADVPGYSRMVGFDEIERNDFNLNIPRYIASTETEDVQDIEAHLHGGIPIADVDALGRYWEVCPGLRAALFADNRPGYVELAVEPGAIKPTIAGHPEFAAFITEMNAVFADWRTRAAVTLKGLEAGFHPKEVIAALSEDLLAHYQGRPLVDPYDIYQHLIDYRDTTMGDDLYLVAADGWRAETYRVLVKNAKGKEVDRGWACDLIPKPLIVAHYFPAEGETVARLEGELEGVTARMTEMEEEHGGEEGAFAELDKVNKGTVAARLKEMGQMTLGEAGGRQNSKGKKQKEGAGVEEETGDERAVLTAWLVLANDQARLKRELKEAEERLDALAYAKYPVLAADEVKELAVTEKWLAALDAAVHGEIDRVSQALTRRVGELAARYALPLPAVAARVAELEARVNRHLAAMGFSVEVASAMEHDA